MFCGRRIFEGVGVVYLEFSGGNKKQEGEAFFYCNFQSKVILTKNYSVNQNSLRSDFNENEGFLTRAVNRFQSL